jgi:hypothetical protein
MGGRRMLAGQQRPPGAVELLTQGPFVVVALVDPAPLKLGTTMLTKSSKLSGISA